jgi:hypothetical protein
MLHIFFIKRQRLVAIVTCVSKSARSTPEVLADAHHPFQGKLFACGRPSMDILFIVFDMFKCRYPLLEIKKK